MADSLFVGEDSPEPEAQESEFVDRLVETAVKMEDEGINVL